MRNRIVFLGTAGDVFAVGKQYRGSGGIVIQVGDYQLLIDPGPGSLVRASQSRVNIRETTALLVSSSQLKHCNDVNAVISAMTYDGMDKQGVLISNEKLAEGGCLTHVDFIEKMITAKPGNRVGVENMEVNVLSTKSSGENVGFKIFTEGFVLSYTSDTEFSVDVAKQYEHSDILIINVVNPRGEKSKDCLNSETAEKIIDRVQPGLAIITGFGKKMLESDPLYEAREIQKKTGVQVIAATDGLAINPISYSADLKQKTLNLYKRSDEHKDSVSDQAASS